MQWTKTFLSSFIHCCSNLKRLPLFQCAHSYSKSRLCKYTQNCICNFQCNECDSQKDLKKQKKLSRTFKTQAHTVLHMQSLIHSSAGVIREGESSWFSISSQAKTWTPIVITAVTTILPGVHTKPLTPEDHNRKRSNVRHTWVTYFGVY